MIKRVVGFQIEIFDLLQELNAVQKLTLLCVSHDLNLASTYAKKLILMQSGRLVASGSPKEILTPDLLKSVYGINAIVQPSPVNGTPQVTPYN